MVRPGLPSEKEGTGAPGRRRVLTALNFDLAGSTNLLNTLDIEDYQDIIGDFQHEVRQAVTALGGRLLDFEGDGGVVTFPVDMDAKDAASLAIQAGFWIIAACRRVAIRWKRADLLVRVGIATSMSLMQDTERPDGGHKFTSAALALAARLQTLAAPGTILVSQETRGLSRRSHLFQLQGKQVIKGFSIPEEIWRAIGPRRKVDRYFAFGNLNAALVGRVEEQQELLKCWLRATQGIGQGLLIEGEAGIGKSRLVHRMRSFMRGKNARRVMFQCHPSGQRTTLHPLLQAMPKLNEGSGQPISGAAIGRLFQETGIFDREAIDIFGYLLGAEGAGAGLKDSELDVIREKSAWAARSCLEALCSTGPLLLVIEDIHWIDPTSLQLLTEVLRAVESLPVLAVLTARPYTNSERPELPNTQVMALGPLERKDANKVIIAKFPRHGKDDNAAMLDLIEKVSGGVPLYIEEICQWAAENLQSAQKALAKNRTPNRLSAFEAVVAARLAQLGDAAHVAGAAAAAGTRFDTALLKAALPALTLPDIVEATVELMKQGFFVQVSLTEPALYGFRHALIRETIYKALLRAERQNIHGHIYSTVRNNRQSAPWIGTAALADHAESAGLTAEAIGCLLEAGHENASRSAMTEARQLLEHGLELCRGIDDRDRRENLMLKTMAMLGPVLTTSEGPGSEPAQRLYEDGAGIARRRPASERATWFPIYWGWWFTGSDVNGERAHALLEEMKDVNSAEVQLQTRHCVWAIDFYLGRHGICVASVDEALPLYDTHPELHNPSSYGGHDTKVCGLAHRGLSLWFKGRTAEAIASLQAAKDWAYGTGHAGSIAHAVINSAMLAAYRRDLSQLKLEIAALREVTASNRLPTLDATAQILEGWCKALEGDAAAGRDLMRLGLDIHRKLQTPEDYPVYCTMLAEVLVKTGETAEARQLLEAMANEQGDTGHAFWFAELHRRRAQLMALSGSEPDHVLSALATSLGIASRQDAVPLILQSYETLVAFDATSALAEQYRERAAAARRHADPDMALFEHAEDMSMPGTRA